MHHVRGAPCHPQTQGKIERWHQTLKNRILLENYYLPGDLKAHIDRFVDHYNHRRYHESLQNLTPAGVPRCRSWSHSVLALPSHSQKSTTAADIPSVSIRRSASARVVGCKVVAPAFSQTAAISRAMRGSSSITRMVHPARLVLDAELPFDAAMSVARMGRCVIPLG
jgi:hypothetical protein